MANRRKFGISGRGYGSETPIANTTGKLLPTLKQIKNNDYDKDFSGEVLSSNYMSGKKYIIIINKHSKLRIEDEKNYYTFPNDPAIEGIIQKKAYDVIVKYNSSYYYSNKSEYHESKEKINIIINKVRKVKFYDKYLKKYKSIYFYNDVKEKEKIEILQKIK